jgi:5-methylcytosine-specific restriction endonuclease McrA
MNKSIIAQIKARDSIAGIPFCRLLSPDCAGPLDIHHIVSRGAGGEDTLDNLITLCRYHHNQAHNGLVSRAKLYALIGEADPQTAAGR